MNTPSNGLIHMDLTKKLSGTQNYLAWKTFQRQVLRSRSLIGYTDGTITKPSPVASGLTVEEWDDRNGKALAQVAINCSNAIMITLDSCVTAADAWKLLGDKYQNTTWLSKSLAKKHLTGTRYTDGNDMPKHIDMLNVCLAKCKAIGIKMEDGEFCMVITDSLAITWDNLIVSLPSTITPDELSAKICIEDSQRHDRGLYQKLLNQALYSASWLGLKPANPRRTCSAVTARNLGT